VTGAILAASWLVAAAGVVMAVVAGLVMGRLLAGLPLLLDLMLAAGLLRLAVATQWPALISAAAIIVIRKLVLAGLRQSRGATVRAAAAE
jgi:hypothetical protein